MIAFLLKQSEVHAGLELMILLSLPPSANRTTVCCHSQYVNIFNIKNYLNV